MPSSGFAGPLCASGSEQSRADMFKYKQNIISKDFAVDDLRSGFSKTASDTCRFHLEIFQTAPQGTEL